MLVNDVPENIEKMWPGLTYCHTIMQSLKLKVFPDGVLNLILDQCKSGVIIAGRYTYEGCFGSLGHPQMDKNSIFYGQHVRL